MDGTDKRKLVIRGKTFQRGKLGCVPTCVERPGKTMRGDENPHVEVFGSNVANGYREFEVISWVRVKIVLLGSGLAVFLIARRT